MGHPAIVYRMAFASVRGINRALATELLQRCGSEEEFFSLPASRLRSLTGHESKIFASDYRARLLQEAEKEYDFVECHGVTASYFTDPDYPRRLHEAVDAPLMLYGLGGADLNCQAVIGIVGTRHATSYGVQITEDIISGLKDLLPVEPLIVSGLAFGIDVCAHQAALRSGLPTAGVLAHGLSTIYPSQHRSVAAEMVRSGGALLTDYRSNDAIHKGNFLARNRIVAGLCDCLLVVESAEKGGALVTASIAAAYNRDVFAVPGRAGDRYSRGCNNLIARNIAQLVTSADDIVDAMGWPRREKSEAVQGNLFPELTPEEAVVCNYLETHDEATLNELSVASGMAIGKLMAAMIDMEFKSIVVSIPGGRYRLR